MSETDDDQLIQAIVAAPDDDAPRLAYAERLRRRGDPRGEFIELQLRDRRTDADWRIRQAAQALRQRYGAAWVPPIAGLTVSAFRRGFPEIISASGEDFLAGAAELFRTVPVSEVSLSQANACLSRIAEMPELARLRVLRLGDDVTAEGLAALAASPWLGGLTGLELWKNPIGDDGAMALATAAGLGRLRSLNLTGCGVGPYGAARLAGSPILARLTDLLLGGNPLSDGVAALAASPHLTLVERLHLPDCRINDDGAAALAASSGLANLVQLSLAENAIGDAGAAAFAGARQLSRLTRLDLSSNTIGEAGAEALAKASGLPALKTLGLSYNPIYKPGAVEDWRDWDGSVVGAGPVKLDVGALGERYGGRFEIT